jgi:hypothetical protein
VLRARGSRGSPAGGAASRGFSAYAGSARRRTVAEVTRGCSLAIGGDGRKQGTGSGVLGPVDPEKTTFLILPAAVALWDRLRSFWADSWIARASSQKVGG